MLYFVSKSFFVLKNDYRYTNLLYLVLVGVIYY